jgi:DNA-binding PadR family transcriptional regulator
MQRSPTDLEFALLSALSADGPDHAYALGRKIEQILLAPVSIAALYKATHRLEAMGLISGEWQSESGRGPRRRRHAITGDGQRALRVGVARRHAMLSLAPENAS